MAKLRYDLKIQRQRREKEASVVKMTPEQRAQLQDEQEEQVDDSMDLDVILYVDLRIYALVPLLSNM